MNESQYLIEQVAMEIPRAGEISIPAWFQQIREWIMTNHDEERQVYEAPETHIRVPFYGTHKTDKKTQTILELQQHTKDKDYPQDHNYLSIVVEQGIFGNREWEQFVILEDNGKCRWFWRTNLHDPWQQLSQNRVPLYAIMSITNSFQIHTPTT